MCRGWTSADLVTLDGAVTPATAAVNVGSLFTAGGPGAGYSSSNPPGTYDVLAVDTVSPRMLVLRDVVVDADRTLDVDLVADGFDRLAVTPEITGADGAQVSLASELHTAAGYMYMNDAPANQACWCRRGWPPTG